MFRSKVQPLIIPQYEHSRMAGILAAQWGNADFDRPALDFQSWVAGVAFHDWHYGQIDNLPIGEMSSEQWLAVAHRGVALRFDHPVTDIVAKLHLRRLLQGEESPERAKLIEEIDTYIDSRLAESGYTLQEFLWADRITKLCDKISFDFSFGLARTESNEVFARQRGDEATAIGYQILPNQTITVDPWPFATAEFFGQITAFGAVGYPERLQPQFLCFSVVNEVME